MMMHDQAEQLRVLMGKAEVTEAVSTPVAVDYRKLYLDAKQELQTVIDRWDFPDSEVESLSEDAYDTFLAGVRYALNRVEQAENIARYVKPAQAGKGE